MPAATAHVGPIPAAALRVEHVDTGHAVIVTMANPLTTIVVAPGVGTVVAQQTGAGGTAPLAETHTATGPAVLRYGGIDIFVEQFGTASTPPGTIDLGVLPGDTQGVITGAVVSLAPGGGFLAAIARATAGGSFEIGTLSTVKKNWSFLASYAMPPANMMQVVAEGGLATVLSLHPGPGGATNEIQAVTIATGAPATTNRTYNGSAMGGQVYDFITTPSQVDALGALTFHGGMPSLAWGLLPPAVKDTFTFDSLQMFVFPTGAASPLTKTGARWLGNDGSAFGIAGVGTAPDGGAAPGMNLYVFGEGGPFEAIAPGLLPGHAIAGPIAMDVASRTSPLAFALDIAWSEADGVHYGQLHCHP
jgi:hypothetical protein